MKKIAIIGKLLEKYYAPFDNPDWEIWGCNVHSDFLKLKRVDKWFDIHISPSKYDFIAPEKIVYRDENFIEEMCRLYGGEFMSILKTY